MKARFSQYTVFFLLLLLAASAAVAQSYGLAFASNEVVQDRRTGIDLSPGGSFQFSKDFELEFDISIQPFRVEYFGYIVRVVANNKTNVDLIYDNTPSHFKIVAGGKTPEIFFNVPGEPRYDSWQRISMRFDLSSRLLTVISGTGNYSQKLEIEEGSKFRILFGENHEGNFQTTDVPPMKIRNITIKESKKIIHSWPLDEEQGFTAPETIARSNAAVTNPVWVRKLHRDWQLQKSFLVQGPASSAFDPDEGIIYMVGYDSLFAFNTKNGVAKAIKYQSGKLNLLRGNQSFFNPGLKKLQNIYIDQALVNSFDQSTANWNKNFTTPAEITDNWHFNPYYSAIDSSLYMFAGYGHFIYKNKIQRYNFASQTWDSLDAGGDFFTPRYLAGIGATKDGAYIMGGYGSQSGQQILNPRNLYDLLYFDARTKKFKKIYELQIKGEDFVFANSLVINEKDRSFYGLVHARHKYDATLQMIRGSLDSPTIKFLANTIPYRFNDIHSFSDLYYCPSTGSLLAITLFYNDNNQTEVSIYSLAAPPLETVIAQTGPMGKTVVPLVAYILGTVLVLLVGITAYLSWRQKMKAAKLPGGTKSKEPDGDLKSQASSVEATKANAEETDSLQNGSSDNSSVSNPDPVIEDASSGTSDQVPAVDEALQTENSDLINGKQSDRPSPPVQKNAILLFGDLQLFDIEGTDITRYFTPLLKELFLVILVYTIRKERGISSEKLKELLWFDKSVESARNNRSVNIAKLKAILDKLPYCGISKETGYWKLNIDYSKVHVDYFEYLSIINDKGKLDKEKVKHLAEITQRGSFLSNVDYDWLDSFKSEISNMVIDTYLRYASGIKISDDPEFLVQIANYIFDFDSVNEEAMIVKCRALAYLGKHSLAKQTFENFNKEYRVLYGEEFRKDFHDIL